MNENGNVTDRSRGDSARGGITDTSTSPTGSCGSGATQRCAVLHSQSGTAPWTPWVASANDASVFPTRYRVTPGT